MLHEAQYPFGYQIGTVIDQKNIAQKQFLKAKYVYTPVFDEAWPHFFIEQKAGLYAGICHRGPYQTISQTYERLLSETDKQGFEITSDGYELCIVDSFLIAREEAYVTEIWIGVKEKKVSE